MRHALTFIVALAVLGGWMLAETEDGRAPDPKSFDNAKVLRIKAIEGEAFVQRSYEDGYEEATVNLPLFEKDLVGTTQGRLEIYLGRMNYLRLDNDSRVQMVQVPELRRTDLTLKIERGGVYLDVASLDSEKSIEVQTPDCGIFLLDQGSYRINVLERGRTEIYVVEGLAEVSGERVSRNVRENQKMVVAGGEVVERPYYFYASDRDDFDQWNQERNRELGSARYSSARYLERGYEDYEYELSRNGRWTYMGDVNGNVWIPYHLGSDWRPYWNGRWVWNPFYGYVWTSFDNWGWFTHHYGRWNWDNGFGWYWVPGYHWSPAWVDWFGDNDYYGWCPLSWWNRPVILFGNRWDRHYDFRRGIPLHSRSTIILRKHELTAPDVSRVAILRGANGADNSRVVSFRGSAPTERPEISRVTVVNGNGERMVFKRGGIVSGDRFQPGAGDTRGGNDETPVIRSRSYGGGKYSGSTVDRRGSSGESGSDAPVFRIRRRDSGSGSEGSPRGNSGGSGGATVSRGGKSSGSSGGSSAAEVKKKEKGGGDFAWVPGSDSPSGSDTPDNAGYGSYRGKYSGGGDSPAVFRSRSGVYSYRGRGGRESAGDDGDSAPVYQGYRPSTSFPGTRSSGGGDESGDPLPPYSFRRRDNGAAKTDGGSSGSSGGSSGWSTYRPRRSGDSSGSGSTPRSSGWSGRSSGSGSGGSYHGGGSSHGSGPVSRGSYSPRSSGSGGSGNSGGGSVRKRD